jgi:hypothetical protein
VIKPHIKYLVIYFSPVKGAKDNSFTTTVSVPSKEAAFFWLIYEKQLTRDEGEYNYKTISKPYDPVEEFELRVNIMESRNLVLNSTSVTFETKLGNVELEKTVNNAKSVSYVYNAGLGEPAPKPNGNTRGEISWPEYTNSSYYANYERKSWNVDTDCDDQVIVKIRVQFIILTILNSLFIYEK